jgi:hypothetical protein
MTSRNKKERAARCIAHAFSFHVRCRCHSRPAGPSTVQDGRFDAHREWFNGNHPRRLERFRTGGRVTVSALNVHHTRVLFRRL